MKSTFLVSRIVRPIAFACIALALWPSVVSMDESLIGRINGLYDSSASSETAKPASNDKETAETSGWIIRIGIPLRPFAKAQWCSSTTTKPTGPSSFKTNETKWQFMGGDMMGFSFSALLIVFGIVGLVVTRRRPVRETSRPGV